MASTSGVFNTSVKQTSYQWYYEIYWRLDSQDVSSNSSVIAFDTHLRSTASSGNWYGCDLTINVNGQSIGCQNNAHLYKDSDCGSGYVRIYHNDDGNKTFGISASGDINGSGVSGSGSWALPTIARASQPTLNKSTAYANGSDNFTIYCNRASTSFTHTITYAFGNLSGQIASGVTDNCTWTPPRSLLSQIPNDATGAGEIVCVTYSGSTNIGTKRVGMTLKADSAVSKPTISAFTATETNSKVKAKGTAITVTQWSAKSLSGTVAAVDSATIKSVVVKNGTVTTTLSLSSGAYTGSMTGMATGTYQLVATDSRGFTNTSIITQTLYTYTYPTIASFTFNRTTQTGSAGSLAASGAYWNQLNNTCSITLERTGISAVTSSGASGAWSVSKSYSDLVYTNSFTAKITVTDYWASTTQTVVLSRSIPPLWIGKDTVKVRNHLFIGDTDIFKLIYPVGSWFCSNNATSPASLFGGTWEQVKDRFLVGAGNLYAVGSTGGEATHTLTIAEIPAHSHNVIVGFRETTNNDWDLRYGDGNRIAFERNSVSASSNTGGGSAFNNLPPYIVAYMWHRVS
jgi:microcystin-dependent protein